MKKQSQSGRAAPSFRELTRAECEEMLKRNNVGRIAFSFHDRVDLEPVNYVFSDEWVHGRTSPGTKLSTLLHHPWVAFEIDEVQGLHDWQSVIVHGVVYIPDPNGSPSDQAAYETSLDLIRHLVPQALDRADPTPWREVIFRIHLDEVTGRASATRARRGSRAR
jgi:nitroimidazol reductase NimA-like FMN-containing flavoprotein (pyridoxamine 5'-phosphate oxidase superfamily)